MAKNQTPIKFDIMEDITTIPDSERKSQVSEYDTIFNQVVASAKPIIGVKVEGKNAKQLYIAFHTRVEHHNKKPERVFNLEMTSRGATYYFSKIGLNGKTYVVLAPTITPTTSAQPQPTISEQIKNKA